MDDVDQLPPLPLVASPSLSTRYWMAQVPERVRVWRRGDLAWAQILGGVDVTESGGVVRVPYTTTGVFSLGADGWRWVYWGGAEPQESPRV